MSEVIHEIRQALSLTTDPDIAELMSQSKFLTLLPGGDKELLFQWSLPYASLILQESLKQASQQVLQKLNVSLSARHEWSLNVPAHEVSTSSKRLPSVKNIIVISSAKGGVGKSTTTANLACALKEAGARVGVLDADIYGPSQPTMFGVYGEPESIDGKMMIPHDAQGIAVNSIGFLIDADAPMIWRGPMVVQALDQLLYQTAWPDLDYLLIDMPPGTGDIQLSLAQKIPVTGAVIVTTPQEIALQDAKRGLKMFEKVHIPILGLVENMAIHHCASCGHAEAIFGAGGGQTMAQEYAVNYLGALPLTLKIREQADVGVPIVVSDPTHPASDLYRHAAHKMLMALARQGRDRGRAFPQIVVQAT